MGKQGQTATNKDNNITKMIALHYCHISLNIACFCKLMAQNWHKNSALVRACSDFSCGRSYNFEDFVWVGFRVMIVGWGLSL